MKNSVIRDPVLAELTAVALLSFQTVSYTIIMSYFNGSVVTVDHSQLR